MEFRKAIKEEAKLRLAFIGPSGSGKTYSSLLIARGLVGEQGRIALIDTEHGSASKYADLFEFDSLNLDQHSPAKYREAIQSAAKAGYDVLIIDSLSHAWTGRGGALEMKDEAARRNRENSFAAWRDITPEHNKLIDAIIGAELHVIATMRSKTEWVLEENERGKKVPKKIGMAPVQRDGMEYEFDVVGDLDTDHVFICSKSRCPELADAVIKKPNGELSDALNRWLAGAPRQSTPTPPSEPEHKPDPSTPGEYNEKSERARLMKLIKQARERLEWSTDDLLEFAPIDPREMNVTELAELMQKMQNKAIDVSNSEQPEQPEPEPNETPSEPVSAEAPDF